MLSSSEDPNLNDIIRFGWGFYMDVLFHPGDATSGESGEFRSRVLRQEKASLTVNPQLRPRRMAGFPKPAGSDTRHVSVAFCSEHCVSYTRCGLRYPQCPHVVVSTSVWGKGSYERVGPLDHGIILRTKDTTRNLPRCTS